MADSELPIPTWAGLATTPSYLVVEGGKDKYALHGKAVHTFGRNSVMCDYVLNDNRTLSRRHAAIIYDEENKQFYIIDLGTGHGTFVCGEKIPPNEPTVIDGDLKFGGSSLGYKLEIESDIDTDLMPPPPSKRAKTTRAIVPPPAAKPVPSISATVAVDKPLTKAEERLQRQAEIAAMIASLDHPPEYKPATVELPDNTSSISSLASEANRRRDLHGADDVVEDDPDGDIEEEVDEAADRLAREDQIAQDWKIPISHEGIIDGHNRAVSAIAVDKAGARFVTGGVDNMVRMYDFGGMNQSHNPIRMFMATEGQPVVGLSYSPTGSQFVVGTGAAKIQVYDREATFVLTTIKGDPYVHDVTHTKGHTAQVTGVMWHPNEAQTFMSCGDDSSVRIWDVNGSQSFDQLICKTVIRARDKRNVARIAVKSATYNPDGKSIAATTSDGAIHIWNYKAKYSTPDIYVRDAHTDEVTSIAWSLSGLQLATRSADCTMKLWDLRKMKAPLRTFANLPNFHSSTTVAFSPDSSVVVTGTSAKRGTEDYGHVMFYEALSGDDTPIKDIHLEKGAGACAMVWQKEIKQIFVGSGSGKTHIFYNPRFLDKARGYLITAGRNTERRKEFFASVSEEAAAVNPDSLPHFDNMDGSKKRKRDQERKDPSKSHAPEEPLRGPSVGGRRGDKSTFTMHLMKTLAKDESRFLDPREALLKYAGDASRGGEGTFVGNAYKGNRNIMGTTTLEEEVEIEKKKGAEIKDR